MREAAAVMPRVDSRPWLDALPVEHPDGQRSLAVAPGDWEAKAVVLEPVAEIHAPSGSSDSSGQNAIDAAARRFTDAACELPWYARLTRQQVRRHLHAVEYEIMRSYPLTRPRALIARDQAARDVDELARMTRLMISDTVREARYHIRRLEKPNIVAQFVVLAVLSRVRAHALERVVAMLRDP